MKSPCSSLTLELLAIGCVQQMRHRVKSVYLTDTSTLRASDLPGYAIALQKCGICHSADYISFQPPGMDLAQWTAEMTKMQHSYGPL